MEELIRVPLLVCVPGEAKRKISDAPFSLLHLAPTLLEAAGVPVPAEFVGRGQWGQLSQGGSAEDVAISECVAGCTNPFAPENRMGPRVLSVRERRFKFVLHFDPQAERLYDLEADPQELSPLAADAERPVRRRLLERAREHLQGSSRDRDPGARLQARLRDLRLEWMKPADKAAPLAS
jgi:arylsulfatase A-like enzyme